MKTIMKGAIRGQKGAAVLTLVLILLVLGGLILTPLLGLMGTGLMSGQVYEKKTAELYAADAGVEDAIWKIQNATEVKPPVACGDPTSWNYTISDVNDKGVAVNITVADNTTGVLYRIISIATTPGTGSRTTLESYVKYTPAIEPDTGSEDDIFSLNMFDLDIFNGAVASKTSMKLANYATVNGDIYCSGKDGLTVGGSCTVNGDIYYCGTYKLDSNFTQHGDKVQNCTIQFPIQDQVNNLTQTLRQQAQAGRNLTGTFKTSVIATNGVLNSTYINGSLTIDSDFALAGTVYVTGTITAALDHITITGSGSLFAVGKIAFFGKKYLTYDVTDSIIMSLSTDDAAIKFGADSSIRALIYAPYGRIWFDGQRITVTGCAVGNAIENNKDYCTFNPKAPEVPPGGLPSSLEIITYTVNP